MKRTLPLLGALGLLFGSLAGAADWPQFRGPNRDGVSAETGLLESWPKDGPPLVWAYKNAGLGFSSVAVVDGTLYTLGTRGKDEIVLALDATKGAELWTAKIGPVFTFSGNTWGDGPRGAPTVDGDRLYALGGFGDLVCLDLAGKGKEVWRLNVVKDLGGEMMTEWGYSESPLVDGDQVIVTPGGAKGTVAALDKTTGKVRWRTAELTNRAPYTSPMAADLGGVRQYLQTSYIADSPEKGFLHGIGVKDGKVLWTSLLAQKHSYSIASNPIVVSKDLVYVTEGNGYGCHLLKVGPDGAVKDLYKPAQQRVMKNNHGGVVLVDGHVYGFSEPNMWVCQDLKTGKMAWNQRVEGSKSGSVCAADGRVYLYTDQGEVTLLAADPAEYKPLGTFTIPQKSQFPATRPTSRASGVWNHPAVANGHLYLRDNELIFCYDVRAKK